MLYDVFICHASEDKQAFVRPLAEALQKENVAVWYDDFSLKLGDSIRRTLDKGLSQSRFGVIVLSEAFFRKKWPQYELDALAQREMRGNDKVILPVWHGVTDADVMQYSAALADRKAVSSEHGLSVVIDEILSVVHPQQSPLIAARDILLEWGVSPPVITDEYWLNVVAASNRVPGFGAVIPEDSGWNRWSFPLPEKGDTGQKWGERLAWTAMQMQWVKTAEEVPITPLTPAALVLDFVCSHSGLLETCMDFPDLTAEYAPQLTIRGFGGPLEETFEAQYQKSLARKATQQNDSGTALTTDAGPPLCDEDWALRHPTFGNFKPSHVAHEYFHGGMFGPSVSPYEEADHVFWLLSSASSWLPGAIHAVLLQGMKGWVSWPWHDVRLEDQGEKWESCGELWNSLHTALEKGRKFKWTDRTKDDALNRISRTKRELKLPETPLDIFNCFTGHQFPENFVIAERGLRQRRTSHSATRANGNPKPERRSRQH